MGKRGTEQASAAAAFSSQRLVADFGAQSEVARGGMQALCARLHAALHGSAARHSAVVAAYQQWKTLFGTACGRDFQRPTKHLQQLGSSYQIEQADLPPSAVLFALHTYYALLVKMLVGHATSRFRRQPSPLHTLLQSGKSDELRRQIESMETDGAFRELIATGTADAASQHLSPSASFGWYTAAWSPGVERLVRRMAARLLPDNPLQAANNPLQAASRARFAPHFAQSVAHAPGGAHPTVTTGSGGGDVLKHVYLSLLPRGVRHELGEYYTPDWLADHVLGAVGFCGRPGHRVLDPACGSGTFLVAAIARIRACQAATAGEDPLGANGPHGTDLCQAILDTVAGYDINPVAVLSARANYLMALGELLQDTQRVDVPVVLCDSILDDSAATAPAGGQFDFIVGNPPWIAWDNLPDDYRQATRSLWQQYGLFSLSGNEGRHGGGKKDLSMLMLYRSADRYLKPHGRLAFVITQTLLQSKGAGDGFRRFRLGADGDWLKVLHVDDMVAIQPFEDAANWTSVMVLEKGEPTQYPVPYVRWLPEEKGGGRKTQGPFAHHRYEAEPIDAAQPGSPWFLRPAGLHAKLRTLIGKSDYTAHLGANSGGANGVYWLTMLGTAAGGIRVCNVPEKGHHRIDVVEAVLEADLLYPLLRWGDVGRYHAAPSAAILLAQDVVTRTGIDQALMQSRYPQSLAYLRRFEPLLRGRAAFRRYQESKPFYSMYNVGPYTVAPIKVVWRRMDRRIRAAVIEPHDDPLLGQRPIVPQETCVVVAATSAAEAHYVCAVLNSAVVNFLVAAHSVDGGKGFGTPGMLDFIRLRQFDPQQRRHEELAMLSRQAHAAAASGASFADIQQAIDRAAAELWELTAAELAVIERELSPFPSERGKAVGEPPPS
jgi:methylase of polypeptide subunit release factors